MGVWREILVTITAKPGDAVAGNANPNRKGSDVTQPTEGAPVAPSSAAPSGGLEIVEQPASVPGVEHPLIEAVGLGLGTKRGQVFSNLSLTAGRGQLVALTGPGGSGHTSVLLVLAGRMKFTSGTLTVSGKPMPKNAKWLRRNSSLCPVPSIDPLVDNMRVKEELRRTQLMAFRLLRDIEPVDLLALVGLDVPPKTFVGDLTEFERSRLRLALGLIVDLPLVLVDDFFRGVPTDEAPGFWQTLRHVVSQTGATLVCNSTNPPPPGDGVVDVHCPMRPIPTEFAP